MSAEPPPPPPDPVPPTPEELPSVARALKRRYKKPDPSEEGPLGNDPDGEIIILSSLLQNLLQRKQSGEQAAPAEAEGRAKINRFVPRGNTAPAPETASSSAESAVPVVPETTSTPSPKEEASAAVATGTLPRFEPRPYVAQPGEWERSGSTWGRGILYFAFAAALALGAFLVGRGDARRADAAVLALDHRPAIGLTNVWTPDNVDPLDKALAADHAGDLPTAQRVVGELTKTMKPNPVLQAYRATVDTRLDHTNDVEANLARLLGPSTPPADAAVLNEALGFNSTRQRHFDHAIDCFAAIVPVRPLDTNNLLHLGEAYRRKGRLTEAVDSFRLALLRLPIDDLPETRTKREYLSYEERLALVENGRDAEFKDELAQHLASPTPAPEWLLTAAAVALQKGDVTTAVNELKQAQAILPPGQFATRMSDYFFRAFAYRPEMNAYLIPPTPEQQQARQQSMDFYLDP